MVIRGEVGGDGETGGWGTKRDTCHEHGMTYESVETLYCTPEMSFTVYVN